MKNLKDILTESILADDSELEKRNVHPLDYTISDSECKFLKDRCNMSKEEFASVLTDIRDNKIGVDNKYYKSIRNKIQQFRWSIGEDSGYFMIWLKMRGITKLRLVINIFKPYFKYNTIKDFDLRYCNPKPEAWCCKQAYIDNTKQYLVEAFDKIMQSTDSKYDKFKNLFRK